MSDLAFISDAECIRESAKAILVKVDGVEVWIPKSQIADESEVWSLKNAGPGDLVIPQWLAEEKGLA